jgi:hypothetical protein
MEEELISLREQKAEHVQQRTELFEKLGAEQEKFMKIDTEHKELLEKYNEVKAENDKT